MPLDLLKTLQQADARPMAVPDIRVTFFNCIDLAKPNRVYTKPLAEFLYGRFQGEVCLRTGRGAISTGTWLVGLNYVATDIHVGTAISAGEMEATKAGQRIGVGS